MKEYDHWKADIHLESRPECIPVSGPFPPVFFNNDAKLFKYVLTQIHIDFSRCIAISRVGKLS